MEADCSAPLVLPQSAPAFAIRAIALLAHTGLPVRSPCIRSCKHGSFAAAVRDFHSKKRICPQQTYPLRSHYEKTLFLYPYVGIIQIRLRVWEPYPTLSQLPASSPFPVLYYYSAVLFGFQLIFISRSFCHPDIQLLPSLKHQYHSSDFHPELPDLLPILSRLLPSFQTLRKVLLHLQ